MESILQEQLAFLVGKIVFDGSQKCLAFQTSLSLFYFTSFSSFLASARLMEPLRCKIPPAPLRSISFCSSLAHRPSNSLMCSLTKDCFSSRADECFQLLPFDSLCEAWASLWFDSLGEVATWSTAHFLSCF